MGIGGIEKGRPNYFFYYNYHPLVITWALVELKSASPTYFFNQSHVQLLNFEFRDHPVLREAGKSSLTFLILNFGTKV